MTTNSNICSPSKEKQFKEEGTCFSKKALENIALLWNKNYGAKLGHIKNIVKLSKNALKKIIDAKFNICKHSEGCIVDTLGQDARNNREISKSLRPLKPREWIKNPYTWLSNYDIQAVMKQYDEDPEYKYKFIGVFPIDFNKKDNLGKCISDEICNLDIKNLFKKGIKYIGLITNLDRHDEPGSHWTSIFISLDPTSKSFGAYYYDSTFDATDKPPSEINEFLNNIKSQIASITPSKVNVNHVNVNHVNVNHFRIDYNKNRHQYKNTECGIFSIVFQVRWIRKLRLKPNTIFEDIINIKMTDKDIHQIRDIVFRNNEKKEII